MYHSIALLPDCNDTVRAYLSGGTIPLIELEHGGGRTSIHVPEPGAAAWLRSLAAQLEDLAEQVDLRAGTALADQHIAAAKAAAGIGGAQ